jgi:ribose transport system permease protein
MTRILGVLLLLVAVYGALIYSIDEGPTVGQLSLVANRQGFYGIITLGAALLILSGGIDLSIGSVIGLGAVLFAYLVQNGAHPYLAALLVVLSGSIIGCINGLLVTRLKLQAFLVTLCGMFVYRGIARLVGASLGGSISLTNMKQARPDALETIDSLRYMLVGKAPDGGLVFPVQFVMLLVLAAILGFFLHKTAYGRYWYAIGHNELAAKYAGVNVNRQRIVVYVICSTLAAFAGVLLLLDYSTLRADNAGIGMELEAITGAVLGGCSIRGGEGTIVGMVLGAMVMPVLNNLITVNGLGSDPIPVIVGLTLLVGTIVDEFIRRRSRLHR